MLIYSQITSKLNDILRDVNFISNRTDEIKRAINNAIDDINAGELGEDTGSDLIVGYNFQRESTDISFVNGTTNYTFSSLSIDEGTFKFADDLIIKTDENIIFSQVDENYFRRKKGVYSSSERMFCVTELAGVKTLKINYDVTDDLTLHHYSSMMVLDGATRQEHFSDDDADAETILIPDRFIMVLIHLAAADLFKQQQGYGDEFIYHQTEGRKRLKRMIQSIGKLQRLPTDRVKIRSEWFSPLSRINNS